MAPPELPTPKNTKVTYKLRRVVIDNLMWWYKDKHTRWRAKAHSLIPSILDIVRELLGKQVCMSRRQSVSKEEREKTPGMVYLHTWICGAGPILESIESDIDSNSTPSKEAETEEAI